MDTAGRAGAEAGMVADGSTTAGISLTGDERRMHVRAYNHWVSLLKGRPYPPISELDPASVADFGPNSVLLDFSASLDDPGVTFLGRSLREECALGADIRRIRDVPARSLLSRLTDHYLQIIANRAPIGFEAEFVGTRGRTTLYRGILMPFSSDGTAIDFIYGVINWKELADPATQASIAAELAAAVRAAPAPTLDAAAAWADGPSTGAPAPAPVFAPEPAPADGGGDTPAADEDDAPPHSLDDHLSRARASAAQVQASDARSRAALYRALARAHDFALAADADAAGYLALLAEAGLRAQARAPMTPVVKLVFGADHDKTRLTEYAAVLGYARRQRVEAGGLAPFIDAVDGGIKAIVAAERRARHPAAPARAADPLDAMRRRPALATIAFPAGEAEFVVLLARANGAGGLDIVARTDAPAAVAAAVRRAA